MPTHPRLAGILFFTPDCIECLELINEAVPTAFDESSSDNSILVVDNSAPDGGQLFLELLISREIPPNARLPIFVTQKEIWSGKEAISSHLTKLLKSPQEYLSSDQFQGSQVADLLNPNSSQSQPTSFLISKDTRLKKQSLFDFFYGNFLKDPIGNGIAVIVLFGMIFSLMYIFKQLIAKPTAGQLTLSSLYPLLCLVAMGIAVYLFISGMVESELSCGPVGECNTVQQSKYSKLFGIIPVSLLGILGYVACIMFWLAARYDVWNQKRLFVVSAWAFSVIAVGFFAYLTFLEPFVIGATCIWCVTSAVVTTISALVITRPALAAMSS